MAFDPNGKSRVRRQAMPSCKDAPFLTRNQKQKEIMSKAFS